MSENPKKKLIFSIIKYPILLIFSFIYLLVFSLWTTPLYKDWYGCDASFFTMAGRGILNGWVPYKDFFDLKGPYFFFIEALGQFFAKARTGAFIIQIFALFFSLVLIIKISRLLLSKKATLIILSVFLLGHISTLWGGNTLEEFMLPLTLLTLYLTIRDYKHYYCLNIRWYTALITGVSFGIMLFAKITVSAPIVGIVLSVILIKLYRKDYFNLIYYLLFALLGLLLAVTPIFIYFGINGCISDMLYSVFIFAFKRSVDYGTRINIRWELKISSCYFAIIYAICQLFDIKNKRIVFREFANRSLYLMLLLMATITAAVFHLGDPFIYYFTTAYPSVLFALMLLIASQDEKVTLFTNWRIDIPMLAFLLSICYFASWTASTLNTVIYDRKNTYYSDYVNQAKEMASLIPLADRDEVYCFNIDMQWFECNQILPCYKYQVNLQFFVALDNRIEENIIDYLKETPPKWLVIGGDLSTYLPNINDLVTSKYENVYTNTYGSLYLLQ